MQRRSFMIFATAAGSGAWLNLAVPSVQVGEPWKIAAWLTMLPDGSAFVQVHKSEMGQGVLTALPMLIAEELELPFSSIRVELAPAASQFRDSRYTQSTGYSSSVSSTYLPFRKLGAASKHMLLAAAAQRWGCSVDRLEVQAGQVFDLDNPLRRVGYGDLVSTARDMPVPSDPDLKIPANYQLIGTSVARVDTPSKIDGSAQFSVDVRLPGMLIAVLVRCPYFGGKLHSHDARATLAISGVVAVQVLSNGVAVLATDFWCAQRGRAALKLVWDPLVNIDQNSAQHEATLTASLSRVGKRAHQIGDLNIFDEVPTANVYWIEADYYTPFLAHAAMEPLAATAWVQKNRCDLWVGTQAPSRAQDWAALSTGLHIADVHVHCLQMGGSFGRRGEWDYIVEVVELARTQQCPVKLMWSREDDMQHDFYRPASAHRLRACVNKQGSLLALSHRIAASSIARRRSPELLTRGGDILLTQGSSDLSYKIPAFYVDYHDIDLGVPVGFWRSVGHSHNGFVLETFIDEIAYAVRSDPLAFRLSLLDKDPRMCAVLQAAADLAGWPGITVSIKDKKPGHGFGLACMRSYGTRVAQVVEVQVSGAEVQVLRVVCAVDCGIVVNPGIVEQQMHSGIVFGLSAALFGEITLESGRVMQSNFHNYPVLRIRQMPQIDVCVIPSAEFPGGCGEPSTPVIAPALANAIRAATGQTIRRLPLSLQV